METKLELPDDTTSIIYRIEAASKKSYGKRKLLRSHFFHRLKPTYAIFKNHHASPSGRKRAMVKCQMCAMLFHYVAPTFIYLPDIWTHKPPSPTPAQHLPAGISPLPNSCGG